MPLNKTSLRYGRKRRVRQWARSSILLLPGILFGTLSGIAALAQTAIDQNAKQAVNFFNQAHALTRGVDFSAATCARALPLLVQASDAWEKAPPEQRNNSYAEMQRAHCEITLGHPNEAAARLRALDASPAAQKDSLLEGSARLLLADLYARGEGVPADPERALALYLLSVPQTEEEKRHRNRSAAEIFRQLQPNEVSAEFYRLLEQGGAPSNWLLATDERNRQNDNRYSILRLQLRGILNASPTLMQSDQTEVQALRTLEEQVGIGFVGWDSLHWPAALVLLQRSGTPTATKALTDLQKKIPYRLVAPDGADWKNADAKH